MRRHVQHKGFTLIELLVSMALFSIVMTVGVGTLLSMIDANRKAQSLKSVMNNLNFALENMSRNIRVGTTYHCGVSVNVPGNLDTPNNCASGGVLFAFEQNGGDTDDSSDQVVYRLNGDRLERSINGGGSFVAITAPEVDITDFMFYVTGTSEADTAQPRVVMSIAGSAGDSEKTRSDFNLQVSVSQRLLDL